MKIHVTDRAGSPHVLESPTGEPLMHALREKDLVEAICGGSCSCATCQVYVDAEWLPKLPAQAGEEVELLGELLNTRESSRLACQLVLDDDLDGLRVTVAPEG